MIKLDKELYYNGIELYRLIDFQGVEILFSDYENSTEIYKESEFIVAKYENNYYILGSGRNTDYHGYKITEKKALSIDTLDKAKDLFFKLDLYYFG